MRKSLSVAAAAALLISMPLAAEAFPVTGPAASGVESPVTLVAGGCGPAFHRGPLGGCRPNGVIMRRPVVCRIVGLIPHRVCR